LVSVLNGEGNVALAAPLFNKDHIPRSKGARGFSFAHSSTLGATPKAARRLEARFWLNGTGSKTGPKRCWRWWAQAQNRRVQSSSNAPLCGHEPKLE
jgi:hypothetical protein